METPANASMRALIVENGSVLMVNHRTREGDIVLSLPGGRAHIGEDPTDTVVREVFEETQLEVEPGDPVAAYAFSWDDGKQGTVSTIFECEVIGGDVNVNANPVPEPLVGFEWVDPDDIEDLPMRPEIRRVIKQHV